MALPMLVGGAECGPSNPLQGLAKRFDHDKGVQQDQFTVGRSGPSREAFRTQHTTAPGVNEEAARFFAHESSQPSLVSPSPNAFDLSLLHASLPPSQAITPPMHTPSPMQLQAQPQRETLGSGWAADFLKQAAGSSSSLSNVKVEGRVTELQKGPVLNNAPPVMGTFLTPPAMGLHPTMSHWSPQPSMLNVQTARPAEVQWDKEFESVEASLSQNSVPQTDIVQRHGELVSEGVTQQRHDADDLARTAGLLVETIKDEQNPKFKNSQFLGLMRRIRDGDVVVNGEELVDRESLPPEALVSDAKGKGKARAAESVSFNEVRSSNTTPLSTVLDPSTSQVPLVRRKSVHFEEKPSLEDLELKQDQEDPNEAYFAQENADFMEYWHSTDWQRQMSGEAENAQLREWGELQDSWDAFEATASGIRHIPSYQFQPRNPYLEGTEYRTRNHMAHLDASQAFYESVLELEAKVQRDPTSARAWYDLGVKQQENEREAKAILALKRALELDPSHLDAWLAIAVSHTNESERSAADDAIEEWVRRNADYKDVTEPFFAAAKLLNGGDESLESLGQMRRHSELIDCLMAMARKGNERGVVDADVQIALAVLLNTSEDYRKAQDCFRSALSVRPDDWQLYNRVGATLANSGNAEEALQYYYRALELNPAYIRARFNLGISCINMKKYEEAAQHILDALVLQDSDGSVRQGHYDNRGITSSALWESLKTTCLHLQRIDLAALCDRKDLDGFRKEFALP